MTRRGVALVGALAVVAAALLWAADLYRVPGRAMQPELRPADRVLVSRLHLLAGAPSRGDLVAFRLPPRASALCGFGGASLQRVVALPREVVAERAGMLFVNGRRLREPYLGRRGRGALTYPPRRVPRDHYFVMGDNRARSCDSRVFGPLPREDLDGVAVAVVWPPRRVGLR